MCVFISTSSLAAEMFGRVHRRRHCWIHYYIVCFGRVCMNLNVKCTAERSCWFIASDKPPPGWITPKCFYTKPLEKQPYIFLSYRKVVLIKWILFLLYFFMMFFNVLARFFHYSIKFRIFETHQTCSLFIAVQL